MPDVTPTPILTADPPALPHERALLDPPTEYAAWREQRPIARIALWGGANTPWLITRYEDAKAVLADPRLSADISAPGFPGLTPSAPPRSPGHIQFMDPPEHGRLRRMVLPDFTFRRIEQLRSAIRQTCERLIDELIAGPAPADLVEAFALPLPTLVICELLGVPYERRAFFQEHSQAFFNTSSTREQMFAARQAIQGYLSELLAAKTEDPADDLLSRLAVDRVATGEASAEEAVGLASLLLVAGHETTAHMVPLGVVALLRHPEQLAALQADPSGWPAAIEELLRYLTIAHTGMRRIATDDIEVGGVTIRAGEGVVVALDSANRDPAAFADPDTLDVARDARSHLAFGHGLHQCVGQSLARAELQIGLPLLFERLPDLRLAEGEPPERYLLRGRAVHGVSRLPVSWGRAAG